MNDHYLTIVDTEDNAIAYAAKHLTHQLGLRHRAFSIFLFSKSKSNHLLLQQRALSKYHAPGLWSNTCCSHPSIHEEIKQACLRRLKQELGMTCRQLHLAGQLAYRAEFDNGLIENEIDHIFIAIEDPETIRINSTEVNEVEWVDVNDVMLSYQQAPEQYTPWFEPALQIAYKKLKEMQC